MTTNTINPQKKLAGLSNSNQQVPVLKSCMLSSFGVLKKAFENIEAKRKSPDI